MGNARHSEGDGESSAAGSGDTREPDLSVPDFEIDGDRPDHAERPSTGDSTRSARFGTGQWLLLWLVITLGVAAGHLLSNLVTSLAVAYQVRAVVSDIAEGLDGAADQAREAAERSRAEAREQRKASQRGRDLARQCEDWRAAHEELNTATTKKNRDKYCGAYREYVETGRVSID